jgi:hypothetical protein
MLRPGATLRNDGCDNCDVAPGPDMYAATGCDRCGVLNSMLVRNDGYDKCDLIVWVRS